LTHHCRTEYVLAITAAESTTESSEAAASDILARAPDAEWQAAAYAQFLLDGPVEDAIYQRLF
jgi:hypothetical protein